MLHSQSFRDYDKEWQECARQHGVSVEFLKGIGEVQRGYTEKKRRRSVALFKMVFTDCRDFSGEL